VSAESARESAGSTRRLFFALWPDGPLRQAIVERRGAIENPGRRAVPVANLHLTLLFLGDQPADRVDALIDAAGQVSAPGFTLRLDRLGWFARARVAWLGGPRVAAGEQLVNALSAVTAGLELEFDRRAWVPHVTLYRDVRQAPRAGEIRPLAWPAAEFALIESISGRPYQVLRSWPLE